MFKSTYLLTIHNFYCLHYCDVDATLKLKQIINNLLNETLVLPKVQNNVIYLGCTKRSQCFCKK